MHYMYPYKCHMIVAQMACTVVGIVGASRNGIPVAGARRRGPRYGRRA
jgi:hypothetical protein